MKVLFAVSNEEISESIVKRYQKEYKEIISYKNVYYFNAILKELQKDKNYDRIVISEELEAFTNTQYDQIDKFIFDKLDSISDEASNLKGEDIPIILICSDRREKSEEMLVKLFGIGIYNALLGNDRSVDNVCKLLNKRIIKKCEEILDTESEDIKKIQRNITIKEDSEKYNLDIHINKKHDKLFKELLSDKKEAVKFINHYLHLNLLDDEIEKYEKEFRTEEFRNIEADVVYKVKNKNVFILIEHQSSLDLKMAYRILRYKNAIIESAINKRRLKEKNYKIPKVIPIVLYTGKRKWQKLSIEDIEEKIEGYEEIKPGYDLVDTNEFTKQQLLEDNLITSKAMLIEKSQNKEELYQNIEDIISCKNKMEDFEYAQLEKIVKYELMGTEDKEIISKFIEKIKNREESENIMMNAARIINKEIRKQRREGREEGREEGMIFVAKKLKGKMHIKDISQITGLSEKEIEKL